MTNDWASLTIAERRLLGFYAWRAFAPNGVIILVTISGTSDLWGARFKVGEPHQLFERPSHLNRFLNSYNITHLEVIQHDE